MSSPQSRPIQTAPHRETEGGHNSVMDKHKSGETATQRARGRPKGSKNKPRTMIDRDTASALLGVVKEILPKEYYDDMRDAIRNGKNISTVNEAKILLKLMGPPLWQRLIEEARPPEQVKAIDVDPDLASELGMTTESKAQFARDTNERLKIVINLMGLI